MDTFNLNLRLFYKDLRAYIAQTQLPIEVKRLVLDDLLREVTVEADRVCLQEQEAATTQQKQEAQPEEAEAITGEVE